MMSEPLKVNLAGPDSKWVSVDMRPPTWPLWAKSIEEIGVPIVYLTPDQMREKFPDWEFAQRL